MKSTENIYVFSHFPRQYLKLRKLKKATIQKSNDINNYNDNDNSMERYGD